MSTLRVNYKVGTVARRVLTGSDFTILGAFQPPTNYSTGADALTHRYVPGVGLRFYSFPSANTGDTVGRVFEYGLPSSDPEDWETGPFSSAHTPTMATNYRLYGDIYQNALYSIVPRGAGTPPYEGLADGLRVTGLYWDETDQRMYWLYTSSYGASDTTDNVVGYSTMDYGAATGTGVGMWKLVPYADGNNRWANGMVSIPSKYATAFGGRRLGVGFGGSYSILSTPTVSMGPALYAVNPDGFTSGTNRDFFNGTALELMIHPYGTTLGPGTHRYTRPSDLKCFNYRSTGDFYQTTDYWNSCDFAPSGVWVDTGTKHGFLVFSLLSVGNVNTTVTSPGKTTFTVADATGLYAGQFIRVETDYDSPPYYFESGTILSVSGNDITMTEAFTGTPESPGSVIAGIWYEGGGGSASGHYTALTIYDPDDLVDVANGALPADEVVPAANVSWDLDHVPSYPLAGGNPNATRMCRVGGATFDSVTNRLYVLYRSAYQYATNDTRPLIYVYQVS